jgi:hypothetical protein
MTSSKGLAFTSQVPVVIPMLLFFLVVLGLELRAYTLSHSTSPSFVMGFFEIGSHQVFSWADFKPQSS